MGITDKTPMSSKKKVGIAAGVLAGLALAGGGGYVALTAGSGGQGAAIAASDVAEAANKEVVAGVATTGTVTPIKQVSVSTTQEGPVASLDVKVGDRVGENQVLGRIDTTGIQRELDSQMAEQAVAAAESSNAIESAQTQLGQLQEQRDKGLNPEINAARQAVSAAQAEFDNAQAAADKAHQASDDNVEEVNQANEAVRTARAALATAKRENMQSGLGVIAAGLNSDDATGLATTLVQSTEAEESVTNAKNALAAAEQSRVNLLAERDAAAADAQRTADAAASALQDANTNLQASELAADQQIAVQQQAVGQAQRSASANFTAADQANSTLQVSMQDATITAPVTGVVSAVGGVVGQPAAGPLVTVADDSTLRVSAEVKEADIAKVKKGDEVTFTTASSPGKNYKGKLVSISPISSDTAALGDAGAAGSAGGSAGAGGGAGAAGGAGGDSTITPKATFPVVIEVTGNREGLRMGSTAKATIVTDRSKGALAVPRAAVDKEEGGQAYVLVVDGDGDSNKNSATLKKVPVTVEAESNIDAAIKGAGLKKGSQVITQVEKYRDLVGQTVHVDGK